MPGVGSAVVYTGVQVTRLCENRLNHPPPFPDISPLAYKEHLVPRVGSKGVALMEILPQASPRTVNNKSRVR